MGQTMPSSRQVICASFRAVSHFFIRDVQFDQKMLYDNQLQTPLSFAYFFVRSCTLVRSPNSSLITDPEAWRDMSV
jgi:hypothetical protein